MTGARPRPRRDRDPYRSAGEATRGFIEEIFAAPVGRSREGLEPADRSVALAVVHELTSWSRVGNFLRIADLADTARLDPGTVRHSLRRLSRHTRLVVEPGEPGARHLWVGFVPSGAVPKIADRDARSTRSARQCGAPVVEKRVEKIEEREKSPGPSPAVGDNRSGSLSDDEQQEESTGNGAKPERPSETMSVREKLAAVLPDRPNVDQPREREQLLGRLRSVGPDGWPALLAQLVDEGTRFAWQSEVEKALRAMSPPDSHYHQRASQRSCQDCEGTTWIDQENGQGAVRCPSCHTGTDTPLTASWTPSPEMRPEPALEPSPTSSGPPSTPLGSHEPASSSPERSHAAEVSGGPEPIAARIAEARQALARGGQ